MTTIKLEHYVPQFYLKRFSIRNDGKVIFCFDKYTSKTFASSIRNIGCEKYFYDIPYKNQTVEKDLAKIEPILGAAYNKLIDKEDLNKLNWHERVSMAYFVIIQELRTKELREFFRDALRKLRDRLSKFKLPEDLQKQLEESNTEEYLKECQIGMFRSVRQFAEIVLGLKWILCINRAKMPFWTSDHPVNRYNPIDLSPLGNLGYLSPGIQIFFPLNPRISLCLCDPVDYYLYPDKMRTDNIDNVTFQNHLQMRWSTRFIFSHDDDDFSLAEEILEKEPILRNADRDRISKVI